jgi:hypothetical protein
MLATMTRYTELMRGRWVFDLRKILLPLVDGLSTMSLTSAGLVINAGGATFAKTGANTFYASAGGVLVSIAAGTAMPALTGINISAGNYNVAAFYVDSGGNLTVNGGNQATTLGGVTFAQPSKGKAMIGFLIITYASAFTGGTTALDTATTSYISSLGPFDPTALV